MDDGPLSYFITMCGYGTWLHGDDRGSVDVRNNAHGDPNLDPNAGLRRAKAARLKSPPITFDARRRAAIRRAIADTCAHRGWRLWAHNVRTNHVHLVVTAPGNPDRVMNSLKSWATRYMVEDGVLAKETKAWSRHGSTRYLWTESDFEAAWTYVVHGQGPDLD